jgi:type II secretory pathway component GspD/PulD (secretin)
MNKLKSMGWISLGLCLCLTSGVWAMQAAAVAAANKAVDATSRADPFGSLDAAPAPVVYTRAAESNEPPPDLYLETVVLRFLDAASVQNVLQQMRTSHGAVSINKANNSVVLCDTRENLDKMVAEIKKADRTPQQVMVEVVLLDVQLTDDSEIGINWDLLSNNRYNFGYRQNFSTSRLQSTPETSGGVAGTTDTVGNATAFNTVGSGGDFSVIFGTVRSVLHLLQEKKNVNILADPKMLVVSGQSATIDAVEQIPYREVTDTAAGGQGALTSTQFKDVGVKLEVKATVTDDNDIFLTVTSEQSVKTGASQDGVPVVDSRKANTSLLLRDGQILVFGGMRREEKTRQVNQIPLLGDLPLVGFLFKSTTMATAKSELVLLLSPRLNPGGPLPVAAAARYEDLHRENWLSGAAEDEEASKDSASDAGKEPVVK